MQKPLISLIFTVYKTEEELKLVFQGLELQSFKDFEVIVAEDDQSPEIAAIVATQQQKGLFSIKHVFQEDKGFRKNKILNAAIREASGTYCTFIDGDCIPHEHFLRDVSRHAQEKVVLAGRRVMLTKRMSKNLLRKQNFKGHIGYWRLVFAGCKHAEKGLYLPVFNVSNTQKQGVFGCNMTISKNDLIRVNGFDEGYMYSCIGEDFDIEWRLRMAGCCVKFLKYQNIVYHLYHEYHHNREKIQINTEIFRKKQQENNWQNLENGLMVL